MSSSQKKNIENVRASSSKVDDNVYASKVGTSSSQKNMEISVPRVSSSKKSKCDQEGKPPLLKKVKTCTSDVWKSFTKIMVDGEKARARCNGCNKELAGSGADGTSHLARHVRNCP